MKHAKSANLATALPNPRSNLITVSCNHDDADYEQYTILSSRTPMQFTIHWKAGSIFLCVFCAISANTIIHMCEVKGDALIRKEPSLKKLGRIKQIQDSR